MRIFPSLPPEHWNQARSCQRGLSTQPRQTICLVRTTPPVVLARLPSKNSNFPSATSRFPCMLESQGPPPNFSVHPENTGHTTCLGDLGRRQVQDGESATSAQSETIALNTPISGLPKRSSANSSSDSPSRLGWMISSTSG
jgi:hypothetical protein